MKIEQTEAWKDTSLIYVNSDEGTIMLPSREVVLPPPVPVVPEHIFRPFTEAFKAALKSEDTATDGGWEILSKEVSEEKILAVLDKEILEAIEAGAPDAIQKAGTCPRCKGSGTEARYERGKSTKIAIERHLPCLCKLRRMYWYERVRAPQRYRHVTLEGLEPDGKSKLPVWKQQKIINFIKALPTVSYFLCGNSGTGKTHIASALYSAALWRAIQANNKVGRSATRSVWCVSATTLLSEITEWESRDKTNPDDDTPLPTVTEKLVSSAIAAGCTPVLFIDEIERFSPTNFKIDKLIEIINLIYACKGGQVIATSNLSFAELKGRWGTENGTAITRRIGEDGGYNLIFEVHGSTQPTPPLPVETAKSAKKTPAKKDEPAVDEESSPEETAPAPTPVAEPSSESASETKKKFGEAIPRRTKSTTAVAPQQPSIAGFTSPNYTRPV